jgi:hypothetical protein
VNRRRSRRIRCKYRADVGGGQEKEGGIRRREGRKNFK